jgi:hypothetical protein
MQAECDRTWQIDAVRDGRLGLQDAESFERHRRMCASCTAQVAANERLRELIRALTYRDPTELELRRVRARVMRDAAGGDPPRKRGGAVSLAAAFAVVLTAVLLMAWSFRTHKPALTARAPATTAAAANPASRSTPAPIAPAPAAGQPYAGSVIPSSDAGWSQKRDARIERVRLERGTLIVHVRPQEPDERFLVELPDGELEVRGTTFSVTVRDGVTTRVGVDDGKVELRMAGQPTRALIANDVWPPPSPVVPARPRHAAPPPTRVVAPAPHIPPGTLIAVDATPLASDDTAHYADAVRLLRDGKYDEAANAFHTLEASRSSATQAEDASYLEAVALARAGRLDAAALVAEHYLDSFPESFHRKEAAILVARAARIRGDCGKARAALAPWRAVMTQGEAERVLSMCF